MHKAYVVQFTSRIFKMLLARKVEGGVLIVVVRMERYDCQIDFHEMLKQYQSVGYRDTEKRILLR